MDGKCDWKSCRDEADLGYLEKEICQKHWIELCELQESGKEKIGFKKIGLPERENKMIKQTMEETVTETQESSTEIQDTQTVIVESQEPAVHETKPQVAPLVRHRKIRRRNVKKVQNNGDANNKDETMESSAVQVNETN